MIDFKKIDDKDFVFINKKLTENEEKSFSDFLKSRKKRRSSFKKKKVEKVNQ